MSDKINTRIQDIITKSKNLAEANVKKSRNERTLQELTLFQNLSHLVSTTTSGLGLDKVFKVGVSVYPSPLRLDPARSSETVSVVVENISKSFSLSCNHWKFILRHGPQTSSWSLDTNFDPGTRQSFSTCFYTNGAISPAPLRLILLFSMSEGQKTFVKSLLLYETVVDILHLLTPSRYPRPDNVMRGHLDALYPVGPYYTVANPGNSATTKTKSGGDTHRKTGASGRRAENRKKSVDQELEDDEELPSITQFFFKLCPNLTKLFLNRILLKDCKIRWQSMGVGEEEISNLVKDPSFLLYYLEDEIILSTKSSGVMAFKCTNPKVLCALKVGILSRLLLMGRVKVTCPSDTVCEKLYALRLRLEDVGQQQQQRMMQASSSVTRDFVDIYLDLRDVSEDIEFSLSNVIISTKDKKRGDTNKEVVVID